MGRNSTGNSQDFVIFHADASGTYLGPKTKWSHPYTYDPILQFGPREQVKGADGLYTDRLLQWDFDKHDRICQEVFGNKGQYWDKRKPEDISRFLSLWLGREVKLVRKVEYCNQATGYPLWWLEYVDA